MSNHIDIKPDEKVCFNCKHMLWMVGIGAGVRCGYAADSKTLIPMIPHLKHTCDKFENKNEKQS